MSSFANTMSCVPFSGSEDPSAQSDQARPHVRRIAGLGRQPAQARDDRIRRAVAEAGGAEGSVQRARHARDAIQHARGGEPRGEVDARAHRPHRVGARRPHADGEQIEGRDVRCHPSSVVGVASPGSASPRPSAHPRISSTSSSTAVGGPATGAHHECRSGAGAEHDRAAVRLDHGAGDRHAEPRAAALARTRRLTAGEALEHGLAHGIGRAPARRPRP